MTAINIPYKEPSIIQIGIVTEINQTANIKRKKLTTSNQQQN